MNTKKSISEGLRGQCKKISLVKSTIFHLNFFETRTGASKVGLIRSHSSLIASFVLKNGFLVYLSQFYLKRDNRCCK